MEDVFPAEGSEGVGPPEAGEELPVDEPPPGDPPADEPPAADPPVDEPPVDEPPAEDPPVEAPPAEGIPAEAVPAGAAPPAAGTIKTAADHAGIVTAYPSLPASTCWLWIPILASCGRFASVGPPDTLSSVAAPLAPAPGMLILTSCAASP